MKMTHKWLKKQIDDYKILLGSLSADESDRGLFNIWRATLNTLESTLHIVELEMSAIKLEMAA